MANYADTCILISIEWFYMYPVIDLSGNTLHLLWIWHVDMLKTILNIIIRRNY